MSKPQKNAVRPDTTDEIAQAYAKLAPELDALNAAEVARVYTDVPTAVSLTLGALPGLEALIPEMKAAFVRPPLAELSRLRTRALGLLYTHLRQVPPTERSLEADLEVAKDLRDRLLSVADAHVRYGEMSANSVAKIREGSGHLDRANDLIALSALFRSSWKSLEPRTLVSRSELDQASELGTRLIALLGERSLSASPPRSGRPWSDQRSRAFTLFLRDYTEIRRAVAYLRFREGDADALAPRMHTRTNRRRSAVKQSPVDPPQPVKE